MAPPRVKALAAVVLLFAFVQVALEEVLVFLDVVGAVPGGSGSYVVMVAVPLLVAGLLLAVLVGAALRSADTLR